MQVMALYMLCGKHHRHSLVRHSLVQLLHALRWHHGSFPSLHMGHSMIRRCIQLCISRGHTICTHILVLISAGAKAQASVSSGQARQTTPAGEGGNDCSVGKRHSAMKRSQKHFRKQSQRHPKQCCCVPSQCAATSQLAGCEKATRCNHRCICPPQYSLTSILLTR